MPPIDDFEAVAQWRASLHAAWGEVHEAHAPHEQHHMAMVGGVRCLVAGAAEHPTVVYAHGGAFVLGSPEVAIPITARLAAGLRVLSVDYRLAPEHPFPAALEDVLAVCRAVGATGAYVLAGDSAGGGLALAAAQSLVAGGGPAPSALALLCPYVEQSTDSEFARAYVQSTDLLDPRLSPLHGDFADLPPLLVQTGTADALHPQAVDVATVARESGCSAELDVWQDLWHTWQYHRDIPEADAALVAVRDFLARHCPAAD